MPLRDFATLVFVCLIWAFNNIVSKYVVSTLGVPPLFYSAARFAIVAAVTWPWLLPMPRPALRMLAIALLMGAGNFALLFIGMTSAPASAVAVVIQLGAPLTTLLSVFMLGERIQWRRGLGIALTFAGVLLVMWDPRGFALAPGLTYIAGSALAGALGAVLMKQMPGQVQPLQFQAWVGFSSVWPLAAATLILEPGAAHVALDAGWRFWSALLFSSFVVSVCAHTLYYLMIRRYEANLIAPLTLMTPLATMALGVAIFGDVFGLQMAAGGLLALSGVLVVVIRREQLMVLLANRGRAIS